MAPKRQRKDVHKATEEALIPVDHALQAHRITLQGGGQGILLGFRVPKVICEQSFINKLPAAAFCIISHGPDQDSCAGLLSSNWRG